MLYEELEQRVRGLPIVARPFNLAILHAALAFEMLAHHLRGLGEREIHAMRALGLPVSVTTFSLVMHGCHRGLTLLLRAIGNANVAIVLPTEPEQAVQNDAVKSLRAVNGLIELFTLMNDVALGWRSFEIQGRTVRAPSKSTLRFGRSVQSDIRKESELNQTFLEASANAPDSTTLHQLLQIWALVLPGGVAYEPDDELLDLAVVGTRRASDVLSEWSIPGEIMVTGAFRVAEYRAASEVVKALAGAAQIFDDYRVPRDPPRLLVKAHDEWVTFLTRRTGVDEAKASQILAFLTYSRGDIHGGGRQSPPAAHTPFLDLEDGRLALVPTLAIWHEAQNALRTIWKTRGPDDYNAQIAGLNHQLSDDTAALFHERGWATVLRRRVQGAGDIDAGTGAGDEFICGECKVFIDDPVRQADDPSVWRELERNVTALGDPESARRTLQNEHLEPRVVRGLLVVPGRAQSPVDFGDDYALVGFDDLRDHTHESQSPRELWVAIKAHEELDSPLVQQVVEIFGEWTIESDGVKKADLLPRPPAAAVEGQP